MTVGVDISKENLATAILDGPVSTFPNTKTGVGNLLANLSAGSTIAMEATGKFHRLLADTAYEQGFRVLVFNPKDVLHYGRSISPRAKTDPVDAGVIAMFACVRKHRTYQPLPPLIEMLRSLVRTRASLVRERVSHENQAREHPDSRSYLAAAVTGIAESIKSLDTQILTLAGSLPRYKLLAAIPGFGPTVAPYILAMLSMGEFRRSDSFVAFVGLDLRVRDSGKRSGKRHLSKRGDPEARRLLFMAAFAASRQQGPFRETYLRYRNKGFSSTEATVFVARKLARVAWAIYKKDEPYRAERVLSQDQEQTPTQTSPQIPLALPEVAPAAISTISQPHRYPIASLPSGART